MVAKRPILALRVEAQLNREMATSNGTLLFLVTVPLYVNSGAVLQQIREWHLTHHPRIY
jgi:hypothetical protein